MRQLQHDTSDRSSHESTVRKKLIAVALGESPADLVIKGGRLINVYTGEIEDGVDIAVSGERIALVGDADECIGADTQVVDVKGAYLAPGFIDSHYHIESSRLAPWRHAEITLPRGVTVLLEDPHEACASGGLDAIRYMLENTRGLPQKVYVQISSATPPSNVETTGGYIGAKEALEALSWPRVMGLGEMMDPQRIYDGDPRLWGLLDTAFQTNQPIEGHSGFSGRNLAAYAAAGVSSTHSPRTPEQALEMLRRGFFVQLKIERELDTIKTLLNSKIDWSRVGLAVDDRPAERILEIGALDNEVRSAIRLGVPPITAYQMATINNANHWRLEKDHGGIAPGRYADILVITDLYQVEVSQVFASGKEVARDGKLTYEMPPRYAPPYARETVHLAGEITPERFKVIAPPGATQVNALVIPPYFWSGTKEEIIMPLPVRGGEVLPDPDRGINKVAVVERHRGTGNIGISFWQWGFQRGAVAMSVLHDNHNILVVGTNDEDMACAVNEIARMQGGMVVVDEGKVLAELALPVFGLMSDADATEVAESIRKLEQAAVYLRKGGEHTVPVHRMPPHLARQLETQPLDVLSFAFLTCTPWRYVITDRGIFDMKDETPVPLIY